MTQGTLVSIMAVTFCTRTKVAFLALAVVAPVQVDTLGQVLITLMLIRGTLVNINATTIVSVLLERSKLFLTVKVLELSEVCLFESSFTLTNERTQVVHTFGPYSNINHL